MAEHKKEFRVSFRSLLSDITQALGWREPTYSQAALGLNVANVSVVKGVGPSVFLFMGAKSESLSESEENAAEQAVDLFVQRKLVLVDDINLDAKENYKACSKFYQMKIEAFQGLDRKGRGKIKLNVPLILPKQVSIDFWSIWLQVVVTYDIVVDEVDVIRQPTGNYFCCCTVTGSSNVLQERVFFGNECATVDGAKQSLAKKVILCLKDIYEFAVKDANYNTMLYARNQCDFQRTRYLSVKVNHVCDPCADGYATPEDSA